MLASDSPIQATKPKIAEFPVPRLGLSRVARAGSPPVDWASRPKEGSESRRVNATATLLPAVSHPTKEGLHPCSREIFTIALGLANWFACFFLTVTHKCFKHTLF
jgi:hypothetical protein